MIETTVLVASIIGIVQVIKSAFNFPSRFVPILALTLGVVATTVYQGFGQEVVFAGIVAGLSASGLYSSVKKVAFNK